MPYLRTFQLRTFKDANVHSINIRCEWNCTLLMTLQLYHLPAPLPPPVGNSSCLLTRCQPLYDSCCAVLLYFSRSCIVRIKMFSLFFVCFLCIICVKKYNKPITVQYYIANYVSLVPRWKKNWTYKCAFKIELVHM